MVTISLEFQDSEYARINSIIQAQGSEYSGFEDADAWVVAALRDLIHRTFGPPASAEIDTLESEVRAKTAQLNALKASTVAVSRKGR